MNSDKNTASETINIYVIVVTFNMLTSLAKTLESVRLVSNKYSMYKFNCIIINGNPNDDGHLIAEEYSDIVFNYIAESDKGIYDAMNKGIFYLPNHGYAIFINSDDELLKIPNLLDDKSDVLFCNVISYDHDSGLKEVFQVSEKKRLSNTNLLRPRLHHQGFFIKNSILKNYRYDLNVGIRADVLLMGMALKNHKSIFSSEEVAIITTGGASDNYTFSNLYSFFKVARELNINIFLILFFSFPEIFKYTIKGLIGKHGILFVRKMKLFINKQKNLRRKAL